MKHLILILALLLQPPPPPAPDVAISWLGAGQVEIRITQHSAATHICLFKGHLLGCMESGPGEHVIVWPNAPTDEQDHVRPGDTFVVEELFYTEDNVGAYSYGPYAPSKVHRYYLPLWGW